jgi:PKD repeat protein
MRLTVAVLLASNVGLSSPCAAGTLGSLEQSSPTSVQVVEYYNASLDHYFITADTAEIRNLDSGTISGWSRTGYQFGAFSSTSSGADLSSVCRYYGSPTAGLDSHFYSGSAEECATIFNKFGESWMLESDNVFRIQMPDAAGSCANGTVPVYRLFNNRRDANHRYTTDPAVRASMIAKGAVAEGSGSSGVAFCANDAGRGNFAHVSPLSVTILVTQTTSDMFSFSSSVAGAVGVVAMAYAWNFGDGTTDTGPAVSHRFATAGTYSVELTVTDDKGDQTSASKSMTVAALTPSAPSSSGTATTSSFDARKNAPGVVRWFDFDSAAQLGSKTYGANVGYSCGAQTCPVIDTDVKASGAGSLRFDIPTRTGSNAAGQWNAEFSPDLSVKFGEDSELYVQWRQRFNQAFLDTFITELNSDGTLIWQGGIKQAIIGPGNTASKIYGSCEAAEIVIQTYYQRRFPISYNSCTGSGSHGPYAGFYETAPYGDFRLQNGTSPYCLYSASGDGKPNSTAAGPGCIPWVATEWMTFRAWIKTGPRNPTTHEFDNSEYKLWVGREGKPSVLAIWWHPGVPGYFPLTAGTPDDPNQSFGKITLLPYMTNKNANQDHALLQTWYDELIISARPIADPDGGTSSSSDAVNSTQPTPYPSAGPSSSSSGWPKWRQNKPVGQWFEIPNTGSMGGVIPPEWAGTVDAWGGFAAGPTTWWSAASSGHGEWWNPVIKIDLAADVPKWQLVRASSKQSDVNLNAYYADGLPTSRHTYTRTQYVNGANASDGRDRVMLFGAYASYGINIPGAYGGGPKVDGFGVADGKWDPAGTWPDMPYYVYLPSVAKDPRTDDVYHSAGYTSARWSAKTNTWSIIQGRPGYSDTKMDAWDDAPSLVDTKRNKVVGLINANGYNADKIIGLSLQSFDIATNVLKTVRVTGDLSIPAKSSIGDRGFVYDADGDRYLYVADGAVYGIDPDSGVSKTIAQVPKPLASEENRVTYFQQLGGVAYLPTFASNIYFLPTR